MFSAQQRAEVFGDGFEFDRHFEGLQLLVGAKNRKEYENVLSKITHKVRMAMHRYSEHHAIGKPEENLEEFSESLLRFWLQLFQEIAATKNAAKDIFAVSLAVVNLVMEDTQRLDLTSITKTAITASFWDFQIRSMLSAGGMNEGVARMSAATDIQTRYHSLRLHKGGYRLFSVSPGLAAELTNTDMSSVKLEELRSPFPSIYVEVPPEADLWIFDPDSGWHRCSGLYVAEDTNAEGELDRLRFMAWGASKNIKDPLDDTVTYWDFDMRDTDCTVGDQLDYLKPDETYEVRGEFGPDAKFELFRIMRWCVAALYWITHSDAKQTRYSDPEAERLDARIKKLPKGSKKRANLGRRLTEMGAVRVTTVGTDISLNRSLLRSDYASATSPATGKERRERRATVVMGHFKMQAHGPKWSLRKRIFISPYIQGDEGGLTEEQRTRVLK